MTSAIIVQIKNENRYLDEWITYHQNLGINHIYLIDNNDINGENPHDIIDKYGDYITYFDQRGNTTEKNININYINVYNSFGYLYDWILFIDIDEYITLVKDNNINDYLSRDIFTEADQILINWMIYDDNDLLFYENKPLQERFTRVIDYNVERPYQLNYICKPFLRSNLHIDEHNIHNIMNFSNPFYTINNCGYKMQQEWSCCEVKKYTLCYIRHYMTKSLEEFISKKLNKKDCMQLYNYSFDSYFLINNKTPEKINYIKTYEIYK